MGVLLIIVAALAGAAVYFSSSGVRLLLRAPVSLVLAVVRVSPSVTVQTWSLDQLLSPELPLTVLPLWNRSIRSLTVAMQAASPVIFPTPCTMLLAELVKHPLVVLKVESMKYQQILLKEWHWEWMQFL